MAITRTPQIDDDGSGTTGTIWNNAWKTELYNQIDGACGILQGWTPRDVSGATLVFPAAAGYYAKVGQIVTFWCDLQFPTTTDGRQVLIGGLPFVCTGISAGGYTTYGVSSVVHIAVGYDAFYLFTPSLTPRTNADMSASHFVCAGQFIAPS